MAKKNPDEKVVEVVTKVTREDVSAMNEGALFADGFDDCLIGVVRRFGSEPLACYDYELVIKKLIERDGMDRDEAEEFFEFNIIGAWVGDNTPAFFVFPPGIGSGGPYMRDGTQPKKP